MTFISMVASSISMALSIDYLTGSRDGGNLVLACLTWVVALIITAMTEEVTQ